MTKRIYLKDLFIIENQLINELDLPTIKDQFMLGYENLSNTNNISGEEAFNNIEKISKGKIQLIQWLASRVVGSKKVKQPLIKPEDIYKFEEYLLIFNKNKNKYPVKDLNQIKTIDEMSDFIKTTADIKSSIEADPTKAKGVSKADKFSKLKIGEVEGFNVFKIPKGATELYNTSCEIGSGTEWCTATGNTSQYFERYIDQGPLYIFVNKSDSSEKYQFHFESGSYMDADDVPINTQLSKEFSNLNEMMQRFKIISGLS